MNQRYTNGIANTNLYRVFMKDDFYLGKIIQEKE